MSQLYGEMVIGEYGTLQIDVQCIGCRFIITLKQGWGYSGFRGECESCHIKYSADNAIPIDVDDQSLGETGFGV